MPLLGSAAMLLSFDIDAEAIDEHDRWHTREHLPERLSIPGFLRGTRWVAIDGAPRYMVLYEVADLATLTGAPYLARLNDPTPWTSRMMPHYRGMRRGLCSVRGSVGHGLGGCAALIGLAGDAARDATLLDRLARDVLPALVAVPGLGSAHLLTGAQAAPMTSEQRIRGADQAVDAALIISGYDERIVADHARALSAELRPADGSAGNPAPAIYRCGYSLTAPEMAG